MTQHNYINCFNVDTQEREHFEVPESVYVYVRQLENACRNEKTLKKLTSIYPHLTRTPNV